MALQSRGELGGVVAVAVLRNLQATRRAGAALVADAEAMR